MKGSSFFMEIFKFIKEKHILLISISMFIILFVYFFIHAAGPLGSDELLYADAGLQGYGNYIVMNRYTHIYLQLFFMSLSPTNLIGMKIFWALVTSITSVTVFLLGRYIGETNNIFHGVFSLLIFLSLNFFKKYFGIPIVDVTNMMFISIYFLVLLLYLSQKSQKFIIVALGCIFLLGFKAKEFSIILILTLAIFGFEEDNKFNLKKLIVNGLYYFIGILLGSILLIIANTIVLNDPLFGFKLSDWVMFRKTIESFTKINPAPDSYLTSLFLSVYYLPFILYLLSSFKQRKSLSPQQIIIWILPLFYIIMITLTMLRSGWRTDERYILPIMGLICALAPQFFSFPLPKTQLDKKKFILYSIISVILFFLTRQILFWFTDLINISFSAFIINYGFNIFFLLLLIVILIFREGKVINNIIIMFFLLLNLYFPLSINIKTSMRGDMAQVVSARFEPLAAFSNQIELCDSNSYTLSNEILNKMRIKQDPNEAAGIFNLYYDTRLNKDNFYFYEKDSVITNTISTTNTDYILITKSEWEDLLKSETPLNSNYLFLMDSSGDYVLLEKSNHNTCP